MDIARWCAIGIDPGKKGALAAFYEDGLIETTKVDTGDAVALAAAFPVRGSALRYGAAIEKVQSFPGQGHVGTFNFGKSAGVAEGVTVAKGFAVELVTPQKWQKLLPFILPTGKANQAARKKLIIQAAMDCWDLPKISSGEADALWIAWWLARERFYAEA